MNIENSILTYKKANFLEYKKIGSKAFNIVKCSANRYNVPDGLILPVSVYFSHSNGENLDIIFHNIVGYFKDTDLIIVRSSAVEEDSSETSYAGQFLSIICKNNTQKIKEACEKCWASYLSQDVKIYNRAMHKGESISAGGMALLIQAVVNASSAGVCFTKDPLKQNENKYIINAVHGLGDVLVDSKAVSDHYEFDLERETISTIVSGKQIFWKSCQTLDNLTPLPVGLIGKQVLDETQINEVANMAQDVTKLFQTQIDMEWAYENDKLTLLQVRPITSIRGNEKYQLWTRDNVADVIPDAVTPLTWSFVKDATNSGFNNALNYLGFNQKSTELFRLFDQKVYFNQSAYQEMLNPKNKNSPFFLLKTGFRYLKLIIKNRYEVAGLNKKFQSELNEIIQTKKITALNELKRFLERYMNAHIRTAVCMEFGFIIIRKLISRHIPDEKVSELIDGLVTGTFEIESTAFSDALIDLARQIRNNPNLADSVLNAHIENIPDMLAAEDEACSKKWEYFLSRFGYSSLKEFEIYYPRWFEDPSYIIITLKKFISQNADINYERHRIERKKIRFESEKKLFNNIPWIYHLFLKIYIKHIRQCSIRRESIKQKIVKIMSEVRKSSLSIAEEQSIDPFDNIFFLTLNEILQLHKNNISPVSTETISERKSEWISNNKQKPFKEIILYSNGRTHRIPYTVGKGNRLTGTPLSSGKYYGTARIVRQPSSIDSFNSGDILVAESTNPSWTPIFTIAGAIVTDMGNYLSHGAIIARELGIPAVGNLFNATNRIKDGDTLYIDGDTGNVFIQ